MREKKTKKQNKMTTLEKTSTAYGLQLRAIAVVLSFFFAFFFSNIFLWLWSVYIQKDWPSLTVTHRHSYPIAKKPMRNRFLNYMTWATSTAWEHYSRSGPLPDYSLQHWATKRHNPFSSDNRTRWGFGRSNVNTRVQCIVFELFFNPRESAQWHNQPREKKKKNTFWKDRF